MQLTRRDLMITGLIATASQAFAAPSRVLTACFSRTGNTGMVAGYISELLGADRFDIAPATSYPLNYEATVAQARDERARDYRPPLKLRNDRTGDYDTILLGYPIWAMTLPPIMRTFLDEHDLAGKTIAPFCTHKGYGRGESMRLIQAMAPQACLLEGFDVEGIQAATARPAVERWLRNISLIRTEY